MRRRIVRAAAHAATMVSLASCTSAVRQVVGPARPVRALQLLEGRETRVTIDRDSAVDFVHVRIVGDTLYGFYNPPAIRTGDSTAIALARIRAVEQREVDAGWTLVLLTSALVALVLIALGTSNGVP